MTKDVEIVDGNSKLREALAADIQRHILDSMHEWKRILFNFTSRVEIIQLQADLGRNETLNKRIAALAGAFHSADEKFDIYHDSCNCLLDIHKTELESKLQTDFQTLINDWYNLKTNIDSLLNGKANEITEERNEVRLQPVEVAAVESSPKVESPEVAGEESVATEIKNHKEPIDYNDSPHKEPIDYNDSPPRKRTNNFFIRLCCCGLHSKQAAAYY